MDTHIRIQTQDFDQGDEYKKLARGCSAGAVVTFVGRVRDFQQAPGTMHLEHYPGMTEKALQKIVLEAEHRWSLLATTVIHRVGQLEPGEQIVFVGVSSVHRSAAFEANQFIMDFLKTRAPIWKKEGETWVAAKDSDEQLLERWRK